MKKRNRIYTVLEPTGSHESNPFPVPGEMLIRRESLHEARITELANAGHNRVVGGLLYGIPVDIDNPKLVIAALEAILTTKIMAEDRFFDR